MHDNDMPPAGQPGERQRCPPALDLIRRANGKPPTTLSMFEKMLDRISVLNRLDDSATTALSLPPAMAGAAAAHESICPKTLINKLNEHCRIVTIESTGDPFWFWAELQISVNGQWQPAASYQYRGGNALMSSHYANGAVRPLMLNLPCRIVREMAREDFNRNWGTHIAEFHRFAP